MKVNIGKSIKIAMAQNERDVNWIAEQLDCTPGNVRYMANRIHIGGATIDKLANLFDMKSSEFVALGEPND